MMMNPFANNPLRTRADLQQAVLDLFALAYFFRKWSEPNAQHRQFHFLMMLSYLTSTASKF